MSAPSTTEQVLRAAGAVAFFSLLLYLALLGLDALITWAVG